MELLLRRRWFTDKSTIGELYVDGVFECFTLEDVVREHKIAGRTAIKAGRYEVVIDFSFKFKKDMPHILDVPEFDGVRIHSGNKPEDTDGCVLVGLVRGVDFIGGSRVAYTALLEKMNKAILAGSKVWLTIKEER